MRKLACLFSLLSVVALTSNAFGWAEWNYAGGSHSWSTAANWGGAVPTTSDDPIMRDAGAGGYAEVGTGVSAVGGTMWMYGPGQADLNVDGGSLALGQLRIGVDGTKTVNVSNGGHVSMSSDSTVGQGGTGYLNITGGSVNGTWMGVGYSGGTGSIALSGNSTASFSGLRGYQGGITVSGGTFTTTSDTTIGEGGAFNLLVNGGVFDQTAGWLYDGFGGTGNISVVAGTLATPNLFLTSSAGHIDLTQGAVLKLKYALADAQFQVNGYVSNGWFTVNGGQSAAGMLNFATEAGTGYTLVTAVPEPVTMLLLGLGGLFIRRK